MGVIFPLWGHAALPALRIVVEQEGPCLLTTSTLAEGLGLSAEETRTTLEAGGFALSRRSQPVAYDLVTNGLVFFGQANTAIDSRETVYLIQPGAGGFLAGEDHSADGVEAAVSPVTLIPCVQHLELNNWCSILLDSRAGAGWMTWQLLNPGRTNSYACPMPGYMGLGTPVSVKVALRSLHPESETDEHRFNVVWGGQTLGTASWNDQLAFVWEGVLPEGSVQGPAGGTLKLVELTKTTAGRSALDWIEIRYSRPAEAESGRLLWEAADNDPAVLSNFAEGPVTVWDVTDPDNPVRLEGISTTPRGGGFACGFRPRPGHRYASFSDAGLRSPKYLRPDESADLSSGANSADWVAVIPPRSLVDFRAGGQWLADFRSAQGLRTRLVTAEAIADTFGGGVLSTGAIRRFVQATGGWSVRPESIVLVGFGSVDYRLESAASVCLLPTPAVPIIYGVGERMGEIVSADASYGDDDGDGVPEVVIGRIPVQTAAELTEALGKIGRFEAVTAGKGKALFTADNPTNGVSVGVNLHASSDAAAGDAAAGGYTPVKAYVSDTQLSSLVLRPAVMAALSNGPAFFLHLGHGDAGQIGWGAAGNGILVNTLLGTVQAWDWPVVGLFPSCQINRFHHPSFPDTFCLEAWRRSGTGFAAIWAPSCKVTDLDGILLGREMVKAWAGDSPLRLAGAIRLAASRVKGRLQYPLVLSCITLLGDPATVIGLNRTARNTPYEWLEAHALTAPNAENTDADGDTFPGWMEYQEGTDPGSTADHPLRLLGIWPGGGRTALEFVSAPGGRYRVLTRDTLSGNQGWSDAAVSLTETGPWLTGGEGVAAADTRTILYVPAGTNRFYKIKVAP